MATIPFVWRARLMFPMLVIPLSVAFMWRGGEASWLIGTPPLAFALILIFASEVEKHGADLRVRRFGAWRVLHREDVERVRGPLLGFMLITLTSKEIPIFGVTDLVKNLQVRSDSSNQHGSTAAVVLMAAIVGVVAGVLLPLAVKPANPRSFFGMASLLIWWINRPIFLSIMAFVLGRAAMKKQEHKTDLFFLILGTAGILVTILKQYAA